MMNPGLIVLIKKNYDYYVKCGIYSLLLSLISHNHIVIMSLFRFIKRI